MSLIFLRLYCWLNILYLEEEKPCCENVVILKTSLSKVYNYDYHNGTFFSWFRLGKKEVHIPSVLSCAVLFLSEILVTRSFPP
jgi:hypothetical protein